MFKKLATLLLSLALVLSNVLIPAQIILAQEGETPPNSFQEAPLNPDFVKYLEGKDAKGPQGEFYGYIPPTMDLSHLDRIPVETSISKDVLPTTWDWRTQGKVTPVKDQGNAGTCWIFGTLASLESRVSIVDNQIYDFSEQNLVTGVDPAWTYLVEDRRNGGGTAMTSTDTLIKKGTRLESTQPYNPSTINTETCNESTPILQRVTDFRIVADSASQITEIKNAIYTYGPVAAAYRSDSSRYINNIYYWTDCIDAANHMISIVGWDDNIAHPAGGGTGVWIVKNSWGTDWGDDGFFYLCYGSANLQEVGSYHGSAGYKNYIPGEHLYYWDEAGVVTAFGLGDSSAWIRSIFTATTLGTLKSIDFWTTSNNTQYQIEIRNSADNLLGTQSGTCAEMGYYTIPLISPISLSGGQQFKIDMKMTTPGYNYPIPAERVVSGYCTPPIQANVSFRKHLDGDSWIDTSTIGNGYNVSLRAIVQEAVSTKDATSLTNTSAILNGSLGSMLGGSNVQVSFEWGETTDYGNTTPSETKYIPGDFSYTLTNLQPTTLYHFKAKAVGANTAYGEDMTFATPPYIITADAGPGGSIEPSGMTPVFNPGDNQAFTITPNTGYEITDVLVDNVSVGAVGSYTFYNITAHHTIFASFAPRVLWSWGHNIYGQLGNGTTTNSSVPVQASISDVTKISAGDYYNLAITTNNYVWGWGSNSFGQLGNGTYSPTLIPVETSTVANAIASGGYHSLALNSDGTVKAWGYNYYGQLGNGTTSGSNIPAQVTGLTGITAISAGTHHNLALKADGTVYAWGWNYYGQLGDGTTSNRNVPVQITGLTGVVAIAVGNYHNLALKSDGTVWAWGNNSYGQLGDGTTINSSTPVQVGGLTGATALTVGGYHNLALKSDGTVWAWGDNGIGQLGTGNFNRSSIPVQVTGLTGVIKVAAGFVHSLALKQDGTVYAWGENYYGQLGNGNTNYSNIPVQTSSLTGVISIAGGERHSVALKSDGTVWTWGNNTDGALGNGSRMGISVPAYANMSGDITSVSAGWYYSMALKSNGTVWQWGSINGSKNPTQVAGLTGVTSVTAGWYHSMALKSDGTVWTWGNNNNGQLGNGTTAYSSNPVQANSLTGVIAIAGGGGHSLAIKPDGTVWAWGYNGYGQLGNGNTTNSSVPVQVSGLTGVIAVSAGDCHSLALKSDGTVWAWGANWAGQLGNNTTIASSTPIQIPGLMAVTAVSCGGSHNLALKSNGSVWTWGDNYYGQLGNGTTNVSKIPVQINGLTGVSRIASGVSHSLALKSDQTVWGWGYNWSGQLGNASYNNCTTPVQVTELTGASAIAAGGYHSLAIKVPAAITVTIASSNNPVVVTQPITYTVTVAPVPPATSIPTGTVTLKTNSFAAQSVVLNASGQATFTTSLMWPGNYSVRTDYNGDSNFAASSSPVITQTINQAATTITVTSPTNPSSFGQPVTFTATVALVPPATTFPIYFYLMSNIVFKDGTEIIGTVPINTAAQASYTTSALTGGNHSITAVYEGNICCLGSTSPAIIQTVNPTFTISIVTTGNGNVVKNPNLPTYTSGAIVTLTATADPGWVFSHWSGDASGTSNQVNVIMNGNKNITANFAPEGVTLINRIKDNPNAYVGQTVKISGGYRGWETGHGSPPVSRSDWVLRDETGSIYVTGIAGLRYPEDLGQAIQATGIVRIKDGQPYIEVPRKGRG